jgi:hypothetical protein
MRRAQPRDFWQDLRNDLRQNWLLSNANRLSSKNEAHFLDPGPWRRTQAPWIRWPFDGQDRGAASHHPQCRHRALQQTARQLVQIRRQAVETAPSSGHLFYHHGSLSHKHEVIFAALRADLAAGVDRDVVVKRALGAGLKRATVAEFFGLSVAQVFQIAGPRQGPPRWTKEQVELLLSMWPDHSAAEIAAALGTTSGAVFNKRARLGLRKSRRKTPAPDNFPPRATVEGSAR